MLRAARHNDKLTSAHCFGAVAKLHSEHAAVHEKHLVFAAVLMPMEFAEELHRLHLLPIELADHHR
jgi:hypothetical protein